nr:MAG TPA: hypothetical protein [Herelleviridae sp.]
MEQQAWEAWEVSKTGKQRTKEKTNRGRPIKTDATDGDPEYYGYDETTVETSAGNPRFLDLLLNIQQRRAKNKRKGGQNGKWIILKEIPESLTSTQINSFKPTL